MLVTICIATYKRDAGLSRLLGSLARMVVPSHWSVVIVVVDNYGEGGARQVCELAQEEFELSVHYSIEKKTGVANVRNRALQEVSELSDYIAFVDDDEEVASEWLLEFSRAIETFEADVYNGPVISKLPDSAPEWVVRGGFFVRPHFESGSVRRAANTGNVFFRRQLLDDMPSWFDVNYGMSGAEDTEFFSRANSLGKRIVWVDSARVVEHVPQSRLNFKWLFNRAMGGQSNAGRLALATTSSRWMAFRILVKCILRLFIFALLLPFLIVAVARFELAIKILLVLAKAWGDFEALSGGRRTTYAGH